VTAGGWYRTGDRAHERLEDAREAVDRVLETLQEDDAQLTARGEALADTLKAAEERLFTGEPCQGICGGRQPWDDVRAAYFVLSSSWRAPSENDRRVMDGSRRALREIVDEVNRVFSGPVADYRRALESAGYQPLPEHDPIRLGGGP